MADALASGASDRKVVWVQVPSPAPKLAFAGFFFYSFFLIHSFQKPEKC